MYDLYASEKARVDSFFHGKLVEYVAFTVRYILKEYPLSSRR